jgi:Zn-dependent metalloprotease
LSYKRLLEHKLKGGSGPSQRDLVFASRTTGALLAVHPKVYNALSMETYDCHYSEYLPGCDLVSTDTEEIHTSDEAVNDAHNNMIKAYNFYSNQFGRDSVDDNGLLLAPLAKCGTADNAGYITLEDDSGVPVAGVMCFGGGFNTDFENAMDVVVHEGALKNALLRVASSARKLTMYC